MKGLITKELIMFIKQYKLQFSISVLLIPFAILSKNIPMLFFPPFLLSMLPISGLAFDEVSHWDKYTYTLPVDKKDIVSSKYISIVILAVIGVVFSVIGNIGIMLSDSGYTSETLCISIIAALLIALTMPSILFPFYMKFGTAKGRIASSIFIALVCGSFATVFSVETDSIFIKIMDKFSNMTMITVVAALVIIAVFIVSWLLSIALYKKHEA